jgi:hypothetical protein
MTHKRSRGEKGGLISVNGYQTSSHSYIILSPDLVGPVDAPTAVEGEGDPQY